MLLGSARLGSVLELPRWGGGGGRGRRKTTTCKRRRRCSFVRKRVGRRVFTWARQLFMNELKLKMAVDARRKWLPREKVMPGKPGGDDGDAHRGRPIREQSARPSPPPPRPVVRNSPATHGRQLGMARTVYAWRVSLGLKIYDCLILDYCCLQTTKIKKYVTSQYWAFTIDIIWYYYNKEYFLVMILYTK